MKPGKIITFALLFGALTGGSILWVSRWREPAYRGIPLSEYFYHMGGTGESTADDEDAFVHFGTNSLPYLRRALQVRDTAQRRLLLWVATRQSVVKIRMRPAVETHQTALIAYKHFLAAVDKGWAEPSAAEACVPEVTALLNDQDAFTRELAQKVLKGIKFVKGDAQSRWYAK